MAKKVVVLVMSVGEYCTNYTAKMLKKIGATENTVICLPKCYEKNADSYNKQGIAVYIYDQDKYKNGEFEYFGFKKVNCGGIGRQGIASAVENLGDTDTIFFQIDDDTSALNVRKVIDGKLKTTSIKKWSNLEKLIIAEEEFFRETGIECMGSTGATIPEAENFISNHKIFNNFIMRKGNRLNFYGFKALCSDDYRYNIYRNLLDATPMISCNLASITFHQNQGDRTDGNAVLYNKDCSWKKSFGLKMIMPFAVSQRIVKEQNRILFRENLEPAKIYPNISVSDKDGNITGEIKW